MNSTPIRESTNIRSAHQPTSSTPSSEHMVIDVAQQPASPIPKPTSSTPRQEHMKTDFTHQPTSSTPRPTSSTPKQEVGVSNSTDQPSTGPSHLVLTASLTANNPCSPLTLSSVVDTSVLSNSVCLHCKNKDHFSLPLAVCCSLVLHWMYSALCNWYVLVFEHPGVAGRLAKWLPFHKQYKWYVHTLCT